MSIDAPLVLLLAPLVGAAVWAGAVWARGVRVRRAARWSDETARIARRAGRGGAASLALAAALGTAALAGPRWGQERVITETRGLNLVLAVDISRSMLAEDVSPSRLERALREARRLVQDLAGDRIGLVAFAGASHVLSPLSVDGSALLLYLDALDSDVASEGGTVLGPALRRGAELLRATPDLADRVLVVFTDGEAHDSLAGVVAEATGLRDLGIHLILVAEGGRAGARIPVRDARGAVTGFQQDGAGWTIETRRRDDVLRAVADAAHGTIVAAELPDQAGAVRDLVASYKRSRSGSASGERGRPRAWMPLVVAVALVAAQAVTRRTAALLALALAVGAASGAAQALRIPGRPRTAAEKAWDRGDTTAAAQAYAAELARRGAGDSAWFNAGTAALAAGEAEAARTALARAATSTDPGLRFRALYNLGLLGLRLAVLDSASREAHLSDAERAYHEALLLRPGDGDAKWNLELALRRRPARGSAGGSDPRPPSTGGGRAPAPPDETPDQGTGGAATAGGLTQAQADAVLRSVAQAELDTRRDRTARTRRAAATRVKDW